MDEDIDEDMDEDMDEDIDDEDDEGDDNIHEDPDYEEGQRIAMPDTYVPRTQYDDDDDDDLMSWEEAGYLDAKDPLLTVVEEEEEDEGPERMEEIEEQELDDLEDEAGYHESTLPGDRNEGVFMLNRRDTSALNRLVAHGYSRGL